MHVTYYKLLTGKRVQPHRKPDLYLSSYGKMLHFVQIDDNRVYTMDRRPTHINNEPIMHSFGL